MNTGLDYYFDRTGWKSRSFASFAMALQRLTSACKQYVEFLQGLDRAKPDRRDGQTVIIASSHKRR